VDRIVSNILGNALDHAAGSDVRLSVSLRRRARLVIEVADGGPGFDPDARIRAHGGGRAAGSA
jgi:signal transduction histidine kinase